MAINDWAKVQGKKTKRSVEKSQRINGNKQQRRTVNIPIPI